MHPRKQWKVFMKGIQGKCSRRFFHVLGVHWVLLMSDSSMRWGCVGLIGNINLIECKEDFVRLKALTFFKKAFPNLLLKCLERGKDIYLSDENAFPCQARNVRRRLLSNLASSIGQGHQRTTVETTLLKYNIISLSIKILSTS